MKSLLSNAIFNGIKTCSSILFPLVTFPYIARVLTPENVGKINFGSAFVGYFATLASLGLTTYAIRECAKVRNDRNELSKVSSEIFTINFIATVIAYVSLFIVLFSREKFENYTTLICIQSLTIILTTLGADWLNSAMEDFKYISLRTMGFQVISLLAMFMFVHNSSDYLVCAVITVFAVGGASVLNIFYRRRYCDICLTFSSDLIKHLRPIMWLFLMMVAQIFLTNTSTIFLGIFCDDKAVGLWSAARRILEGVDQLMSSLLWILLPRMAYYFGNSNFDEINNLLNKVLGIFVALGFPCAIGLFSLSEEIVLVLAGNQYVEAAVVLQVLSCSMILSLFGGSFLGNIVLLSSGKEKTYMWICALVALVNMGIGYFAIPIYRQVGAAFAGVGTSITMLLVLLLTMDKRIKITGLLEKVIGPVVGCVAIYLFCTYAKTFTNIVGINLLGGIVGSAIIYASVLWVMKNMAFMSILGRFGIGK